MKDESYQLDPEHPAHRGKLDRHQRQINRNEEHRESLLPSSQATRQPLAEEEKPAPLTEVERLLRPGLAWQPSAVKDRDPRLIRGTEHGA